MEQCVKDELRLEWGEYFAVVFGVQLGAWLITEAVVRLLLHEPVMAGGGAAAGTGLFIVFVMAFGQCAVHFDMQISMGRTRRDAFLSLLVSQLLLGVCSVLFSGVLSGLSEGVGVLVDGARRGLNVGQIILGDYAAVCAAGLVCCVAFGVLAGTLVQRFGRAAFWVLYAVMIVPMLLAEHLMRLFAPDTGALGFVTRALMPLGAAGPAVLLAAGALVFALAGWLVLRRTSVRV